MELDTQDARETLKISIKRKHGPSPGQRNSANEVIHRRAYQTPSAAHISRVGCGFEIIRR
jgi:hypothetical protein